MLNFGVVLYKVGLAKFARFIRLEATGSAETFVYVIGIISQKTVIL
jgi:hypothetical protein